MLGAGAGQRLPARTSTNRGRLLGPRPDLPPLGFFGVEPRGFGIVGIHGRCDACDRKDDSVAVLELGWCRGWFLGSRGARDPPIGARRLHWRVTDSRAAAARTLTFTLLGAAAAACSVHDSSGWSVGSGGSASPSTGGATSLSGAGGAPLVTTCSSDERAAIATEMEATFAREAPCFSGYLFDASAGESGKWTVSPGVGGGCFEYSVCSSLDGFNTDALSSALSVSTLPECRLISPIRIEGDSQLELNALTGAVKAAACLPEYSGSSFSIQVDAAGHFVDVIGPSLTSETLDCIRAALVGLSFPCLGSAQICPEVCIIE